ncbi:hypothetical protein HNQ94_001429 [Salirhabdus euzebyi]|uniref:Uncharacterized protein n=1 Tax=Salirhabdus euzebyi TaxID=394506 RepID=A0A841Q3N1_9BACI|nr:hypothetical protein [Salirhabdus euzebyi]MBB6452983.1 hypothetical protein [Salirhabdus euzebyi]
MGDSESIWTWGAASSFLIGFIIFFIWNFFMLKQEEKKYWYHGLAAYIITICAFLFFFQYM